MKSVATQMLVDLKLTTKNIFLWITLGFLVLIVITANFLLPKEMATASLTVAHYGMALAGRQEAGSKFELEELVHQNSHMIGVYEENGELVVLANGLGEKQVALALASVFGSTTVRPVDSLHTGQIVEPAPFNKRMVPLLISLEAVMTGILLAGVLMLTEKEKRITRVYRVSPAGAFSYVLAKTLLFSLVGTVYCVLIAVFTVGFSFHFAPFLLLSFLSSALFTLMGMCVSVFLQSLSNWLMWMAFLIGTNTLVLFAYMFPAISMGPMKYLPAYSMIFAFEQTLFGPARFTGNGFVTLTFWTLALFALCLVCTKYRLLRPHKGE